MSQTRVGFAGLGLMGSRMARHFLKKGFPLTVWNRSAERCAAPRPRAPPWPPRPGSWPSAATWW